VFVLLVVTLTATTDPSEPYAILLAGIGLGGSLLLIGLYAVYVSQQILVPVNRIAAATESFAAGILTDLEGNIQIANRPMRRSAVDLGFRVGPNVVDQLLSVSGKVLEPERYIETMERLRVRPEQASADEFELFGGRSFVGYTAPVRGEAGSGASGRCAR
jgi:hypothetical protein